MISGRMWPSVRQFYYAVVGMYPNTNRSEGNSSRRGIALKSAAYFPIA
jgi:hypothetical protein